MPIDVSGLTIERIIVHQLFEKQGHAPAQPPRKGEKLITFESEPHNALENRFEKVLASRTKSIEVEIDKVDKGSTFQLAASLIECTPETFVDTSYMMAVSLTAVQSQKGIYGGLVAIISGCHGSDRRRFVAILRAAAKPGFHMADEDDGSLGLHYLKEIVLGEDTKLYKVGFFSEINHRDLDKLRQPSDFEVLVYDHQITKSRDDKAATYFYESFLGCKVHRDSQAWGLKFYDETLAYIQQSSLPTETKIAEQQRLVNYVRGPGADVNIAEFSADMPDANFAQGYERVMEKKGVPNRSIVKDTETLNVRSRDHLIRLTGNVLIRIPRSVFMANGFEVLASEDGFTTLKIPGQLTEE